MSSLPLDLHITILGLLPPARCRSTDDEAIRTLISYSNANSLLREASLMPQLWKAHYRTRYRHSDQKNEEERKVKHNGDWRLMYQERRRMDRMALKLLRGIALYRIGRIDKVLILSKMSLDVWDVLDIEVERELPPVLSYPQMDPPYLGTQRYWARCMLEVIARGQAVDVWTTLPSTSSVPQSERASFEQTMLALSGFFGKSSQDLTSYLEELAVDCRRYIQGKNITLDPQSPYYDIPTICKSICRFMFDQGYGPAEIDLGVFEILGQFPHAYLLTHKQTLPIALIQIFVSLAKRLDLDASPVNFPRTVLCHIQSTREGEGPFYVNAFVTDPDSCMFDVQGSLSLESSFFTAPEQLNHYLAPADAPTMLIRVARNLLTSFTRSGPLPHDISQNCLYITTIIHLLFNGDINAISQLLNTIDLRPIDCATFLTNRLAPALTTPAKVLLESFCKPILDDEDLQAATVRFRGTSPPVKYFIGLPFRHKRYGYIACITSWDEGCVASEEWIRQMGVDSLDRGRQQPFYTSFVLDGGSTQRYVAEENIEPIPLSVDFISQFFEKHSNMFMYFQSVELEETDEPKQEKRWRMVLSPELSFGYPEDEMIGSIWVKKGILPHLDRGG